MSDYIIKVENLVKRFSGLVAVNGISFNILKRRYKESPFSSHEILHLMSPGWPVYQLVMEPSSLQSSGQWPGS